MATLRVLCQIASSAARGDVLSNIPTFEKRCRVLGEPCAAFAGFEGLAAGILAVVDTESPRKQLELHLQVAGLFSRALPAAPPLVAHEEPAKTPYYYSLWPDTFQFN